MKSNVTSYNFFRKLAKLPWINEIWLYGSRARGDHEERSDIDLAILCPLATRAEWLEIKEIIEKADTLLQIDCVRFDEIMDTRFSKAINRDKKVLFSRSKK